MSREPAFPRGVVWLEVGGIVATNGRAIARSNDSNKDTDTVGDVQAQLAADGLRPASCAEWKVQELLHRRGGHAEITFEDCAHRAVRAELVLDAKGDIHWRPAR